MQNTHSSDKSCFSFYGPICLKSLAWQRGGARGQRAALGLNTGYIPLLTFQLPFCWCGIREGRSLPLRSVMNGLCVKGSHVGQLHLSLFSIGTSVHPVSPWGRVKQCFWFSAWVNYSSLDWAGGSSRGRSGQLSSWEDGALQWASQHSQWPFYPTSIGHTTLAITRLK